MKSEKLYQRITKLIQKQGFKELKLDPVIETKYIRVWKCFQIRKGFVFENVFKFEKSFKFENIFRFENTI